MGSVGGIPGKAGIALFGKACGTAFEIFGALHPIRRSYHGS